MIGLGVCRSFRGFMCYPVSRNKSSAERLIYEITISKVFNINIAN